jgi:hypothetical protein
MFLHSKMATTTEQNSQPPIRPAEGCAVQFSTQFHKKPSLRTGGGIRAIVGGEQCGGYYLIVLYLL